MEPQLPNVAQAVVDTLRRLAEWREVPVFGIGSCASMENEPPGRRPSDLLAGARSMVCFGIPIPRTVYQAGPYMTEMIWRSQSTLYRRLDTLSLDLAQVLETEGALAMPIYGCCPMAVDRQGRVIGYANLLRMGEQAGIGRRGRSGLLLHPQYGARLMLGGVLTSMDLPSMRPPDGELPDCPTGCRNCIEACPARAISKRARRVDVMRCLAYTARTPFMSKLRFAFLCRTRPSAAARLMNTRAFDEHMMHVCSRCISACPYGEA